MTPEDTLRRFAAFEHAPPSSAEIDELIAALSSVETVERMADNDPGWSGFGVGQIDLVEVAASAERLLGLYPAESFPALARAYNRLPVPARQRVRRVFESAPPAVWTDMRANVRAAIVDHIARFPGTAPDAAECQEFHAMHYWHHRLLLALERGEQSDAVALVVEGMSSASFWQGQRASEFAAQFPGSEPLALGLANALLHPRTTNVPPWFNTALANVGVRLPKETVSRLAEALQHPASGAHEWALLGALEPYVNDPSRLDARLRPIVVRTLAQLCATSTNEGHFRMASAMAGRDDVGRELAPLLASQLRVADESALIRTLERIGFFGPSMAPLLPRLVDMLETGAPGRVRLLVLKAIERMGGSAAPAVPALVRVLEKTGDDAAVSALGAIGPAASAATGNIQRLHAAPGSSSRMKIAAAEALRRITGARPA